MGGDNIDLRFPSFTPRMSALGSVHPVHSSWTAPMSHYEFPSFTPRTSALVSVHPVHSSRTAPMSHYEYN
eukprot:scaffold2762_cov66-Cyclotella_meneghiniana.AAC.1